MGEVQQRLRTCRGCRKTFDESGDICEEPGCELCVRCHRTALGFPQPHPFIYLEDGEQLTKEIR